jgi:hypothetical protein
LAAAQNEDAIADADEFFDFGRDDESGAAVVGVVVDELVYFGFRADVNAASGFVEDEEFGRVEEPFAENDFLLVAAAERAGGLLVGGFWVELDELADVADGGLEGIGVEAADVRVFVKRGQREIVRDGGVDDEGLGNFDELAFAGGERFERGLRSDFEADIVKKLGTAIVKFGAADEGKKFGFWETGEEKIFGNGEIWKEIEFLVNESDAVGFGVLGRFGFVRRGVEDAFRRRPP